MKPKPINIDLTEISHKYTLADLVPELVEALAFMYMATDNARASGCYAAALEIEYREQIESYRTTLSKAKTLMDVKFVRRDNEDRN